LHIDLETLEKTDVNFKSKLIEWAQKEKHQIDFEMLGETGEGYNKMYEVRVVINQENMGKAMDFSIKGAEQLAAEKSWNLLIEKGIVIE